jgi:hypothetical protein
VLEGERDLGGDVEGQRRKRGVHGVDHATGVVGAAEKVGVAEADVPGPQRDELRDVGHDVVDRDDAGAAVVHGRDGAVPAARDAATSGFDRTGEAPLLADRELRVALQRREQVACGRGADGSPAVDPLDQGCEVLPRERHAVVPDGGVEAVEGDGHRDVGEQPERESHRRVHRHRDRDPVDSVEQGAVPRVDGQVDAAHVVTAGAQLAGRHREVDGLVTELVGRHEEDAHQASIESITTSSRPAASRSEVTTAPGVAPRANRKPR